MLTSSIYIHIPFCDNLCSYCDFTKVLNYSKFVDLYLDVLEKEIQDRYLGEEIHTLYIGGGTPSALGIDSLKRLGKIISGFNLKDSEISFELNVESATEEKLRYLYSIGVNRLSFGVQTFNDELLKVINRKHTKEETVKTIELAKEIGFNNISIDLMFNLPNQTISDLKQDLDLFLKLDINHISVYSLILEEKSVFGHKKIDVDYDNFDVWYYEVLETLTSNNYVHYETSNFAKAGYESKHNLVYWDTKNYYGFGLGASSYIDNVRSNNTSVITKYLKGQCLEDTQVLTKLEQMQEFMFLGLRKVEGVKFDDFYKKYNKHISDIFDISVIDKDLIVIDKASIKLSKKGLIQANDVMMHFV